MEFCENVFLSIFSTDSAPACSCSRNYNRMYSLKHRPDLWARDFLYDIVSISYGYVTLPPLSKTQINWVISDDNDDDNDNCYNH